MSSITQIPKGIARDLGLPGRDILRGVRSTLAPARALFPQPVQVVLQTVDASVASPALPDRLRAVADFFSSKCEDSVQFAMVAHAGLTETLRQMHRDDLLVSETVLALACRRAAMPSQSCTTHAAAAITISMIKLHAVGRVPGTPFGLEQSDVEDIAVAVFTLVLWFLVDRPDSGQSEAVLLKLCHDVAVTQRTDVLAAVSDKAQLAALLDANARMI